jgi:hypothetical protein
MDGCMDDSCDVERGFGHPGSRKSFKVMRKQRGLEVGERYESRW